MRCPGALRCGGPRWGAQRPVKGSWNTCPLKRIVPPSRPRMHPWNLYTERTNGNPNRLSRAPRLRAVLGRCLGPRETRIVNSPSPGTGQQLERSVPIIFLPFPGNTASHSLLQAGAWQGLCREPRMRAAGRPFFRGSPRSAETRRVQSSANLFLTSSLLGGP